MTIQEAIKTLHELRRETNDSWYEEVYDKAISALEKQIPKIVIAEGDAYSDGAMVYDTFYCPSCDHCMEEDELQDYCPNCGQKIYWEVE
jgi:rubrerythrin